ncbi:MAG TPA: lytic transglycosylase domain-containing protein [Nocardioidaceae bacterium]|nr:lytic transglycosylase domain-containing protein [Nocardioidaceae bacterium]
MPRRDAYAPKHRNAPAEPALKKSLRKSVMFSGVAVVATGVAVTSGVFIKDGAPADSADTTLAAQAQSQSQSQRVSADFSTDRGNEVSRSASRSALDDSKKELLDQESGGQVTKTEDLTDDDPRTIARAMLDDFGFSESEFSCLDSLYVSESDWDMHADNPSSSAYGIPQALTGGTHDLPADYKTNPVSQIRWGLEYIEDSYGTPCSAWEFKQSHNWY